MPLEGRVMMESVGLAFAVFVILLLNHELVWVPLGVRSGGVSQDTVVSFEWSLDDAMVVLLGETDASVVMNHFGMLPWWCKVDLI